MKVASGIEKNTPQKPNIVPNRNTARIIIIGWSFTASEKIIGTSKFPSMNCCLLYTSDAADDS